MHKRCNVCPYKQNAQENVRRAKERRMPLPDACLHSCRLPEQKVKPPSNKVWFLLWGLGLLIPALLAIAFYINLPAILCR